VEQLGSRRQPGPLDDPLKLRSQVDPLIAASGNDKLRVHVGRKSNFVQVLPQFGKPLNALACGHLFGTNGKADLAAALGLVSVGA